MIAAPQDPPLVGRPARRLPRRSILVVGAGLLVGRAVAARAQDQPATAATPAPAATPATDATPATGAARPADGQCPVGCWAVSDIGAFIESGLMDVTGVRDLTYVGAEGALRFVFSADVAVRIVAEAYRVAVSAKIRFVGGVDTAVAFDGELAGRYTLVGDVLTISDVTRKDLAITAETPVGDVGIDNDDFFAGGASRLVCDADANTLRLYPDPANEAAIVLIRVDD